MYALSNGVGDCREKAERDDKEQETVAVLARDSQGRLPGKRRHLSPRWEGNERVIHAPSAGSVFHRGKGPCRTFEAGGYGHVGGKLRGRLSCEQRAVEMK